MATPPLNGIPFLLPHLLLSSLFFCEEYKGCACETDKHGKLRAPACFSRSRQATLFLSSAFLR
ncbi:hypothetical protein, partial [Stomatobaculum longum]